MGGECAVLNFQFCFLVLLTFEPGPFNPPSPPFLPTPLQLGVELRASCLLGRHFAS
jgi:hypothetical protein